MSEQHGMTNNAANRRHFLGASFAATALAFAGTGTLGGSPTPPH
jgi:hypothetical protein